MKQHRTRVLRELAFLPLPLHRHFHPGGAWKPLCRLSTRLLHVVLNFPEDSPRSSLVDVWARVDYLVQAPRFTGEGKALFTLLTHPRCQDTPKLFPSV